MRRYDQRGYPVDEVSFPGMEITPSDSEVVREYILRQQQAKDNRENANIAQGAATIGAALSGADPNDKFYEGLREQADQPVKDLATRQKAQMDQIRFVREGQQAEREDRRAAKEEEISDPKSAPSRVFQNALKSAAPGMFSDEDLQTISAADKDRILSLAQLKETIAARKQAAATKAGAAGTKGQDAADRAFAKTYEDFVASGGSEDVKKGLRQLREVSAALTPDSGLTGPVRGSTPDWIRNFTNPEAVATREAVEEVVQRNLRLILGAQFTEREGKALIARAFNPRLSPEENKKRVDRLITQIENAAQAKANAAQYFEEHGTLKGFKGTMVNSASDFLKEEPEAAKAPPERGFVKNGYMFKGGDPSKEENWVEVPSE